jgi:1-acyl-sn-glycerol-3-phosphate acyltransferase
MLAVPHTTNLDGLLLVLLTRSIGLRAHWMVKDVWVKPPFGWLTKRVGAVPVDRSKANGMVGQMAEKFAASDEFILLIPPEGTRSSADHWKSGFYRIAIEANVPLIPAYVDYRSRRGGFGAPITLTGDKRADMDVIRAFYAEAREMAHAPEKFGPMRLSDED